MRAPVPALRTLVLAAVLALGLVLTPGPAARATSDGVTGAVIVMYHRFGENAYPTTNVRLAQFEAHLAEFKQGGYTVMALPDIVAAFQAGKRLPDRTVAITVDDAYASVYSEAWPRLKRAGLPFTLFVATDPLDANARGMMTWEQVRELARAGVTIGHHTDSHLHMPLVGAEEAERAIARASERFRAELGAVPALFAYPYGEYSLANVETVKRAGFAAAFGQHSGVAHAGAPRYTLPRFALNENYAEIQRFRVVVNALPLPVSEVMPPDTLLSGAGNPPPFGFTVAEGIANVEHLNCFGSTGTTRVERLGERRFEVRLDRPFPSGRGRFNCTLPGPENRFRWFGQQFVIP